jgi:hypothetical protein
MRTKGILLGLLALATLTACSLTENNSSSHQNSEVSSQSQTLESSASFSSEWQESSVSESLEEESSMEDSSLEGSSEESAEESASEEEKDVYYTVTFDTDGGSDVAAVTLLKGEKIPIPEEPSKASKDCEYVFLGWYYNGEAWDFERGVVEDMTLVARWKAKEYYTDPFLPKN